MRFEYKVAYNIPEGLKPYGIVSQNTGLATSETLEELGITAMYYFGTFAPHNCYFEAKGKSGAFFDIYFDEWEMEPYRDKFVATPIPAELFGW